jgi:hypothetical protein
MIRSVPKLVNVGLVIVFVLFMFSVGALQLWMGVLRRQCVSLSDGSLDPEGRLCSAYSTGRQCPEGYYCDPHGPNPDYGATSFDDIGYVFIAMLRTLSLDMWNSVMNYVQDAYSVYVVPFFYISVILCAFIVSPLVWLVMNDALGDAMAAEAEEKQKAAEREASVARTLLFKSGDAASCAAAESGGVEPPAGIPAPASDGRNETSATAAAGGNCCTISELGKPGTTLPAASSGLSPRQPGSADAVERGPPPETVLGVSRSATVAPADGWQASPSGTGKSCSRTRQRCAAIASSPWFLATMMVVVGLNALVLSIQHHGMSDGLARGLDIANIVFTAIFVVELLFRLCGLGIVEFCRDGYNVVDFIVVVISLIEVSLSSMGTFTVFRLLRLLRVLKLLR